MPKTLVELIKFVDQNNGANFADSFYLNDDIEDDFFESWLDDGETDDEKRKEYAEHMIVFANADGTGSSYAMWIQEGNTDLEKAPIIFYGSEGEIEIVAQNLKDLLKILSWGAEAIYFCHFNDNDDDDEDYDYYKEFLGYRTNFLKFRKWMQDTLNIKPVSIEALIANETDESEEVNALVKKAKKKYQKTFDKWQYQFYRSQEEIDKEYAVKYEEKYHKIKKDLLAKISKKPTGDLYLELAKNEDLLEDINHDQKDAYLEKGLEIEPNHIEILKMYANRIEFSNPKKSVELYTRLLEIHPKPAKFYSKIAYVYKRDNKKLKAIEFYQKDIIENPKSYGTYSQDYIVDICKKLKSKDAITVLEDSLSHGINANTHLVLYKLYYNKKNYQKALENVLNYIEHSDEQAHNYIHIAERFFKKELYVEAEQIFRKTLSRHDWDSRKMRNYNHIGLCNLRKKPMDIDKAYEAFVNAYNLDKKEVAMRQNIYLCGAMYYRNKAYDKALEALEFSVKIGFNNYSCYALLCSLYNWKGENGKALKHFEKALALDPENEEIIKNMAIVKKAIAKKKE